jgi:hypothetical protein
MLLRCYCAACRIQQLTVALIANTLVVTLIVNAYIKAKIPLLENDKGAKGFDFK